MSDQSTDAYLLGLAREYLDLVAATQGGAGEPEDRPHAASYRAVVHDQILQALALAREDPFDVIAWAKSIAAAADRAARPAEQG